MNNYTERLELPEGQWATLLTRLPADRAQAIKLAIAREQDTRKKDMSVFDPAFTEAVLRAVLLECSVKDYLTGETVTDIGKADPRVKDKVEVRAFELYNAWSVEAYPGPKGSPRTDSPTPPSGKTPKASATREPR